MVKKANKFILCGLMLVTSVFSRPIFAGGIGDIEAEFTARCQTFKYDDSMVDRADMDICATHSIDAISMAPWEEVSDCYVGLFKSNSGNCRVSSAYFARRFDEECIENRELNVVFGVGNMHTVNLYRTTDNEWYVADFTAASKDPRNASTYFMIPVKSYVLKIKDSHTNQQALAFGVYNKTDRGGVDLRNFLPELRPTLDKYSFMIYCGLHAHEPISVIPSAIPTDDVFDYDFFAEIYKSLFGKDF